MENKDNIVNYDFWYTPDMEEVYEILLDFHSYQCLIEICFLNSRFNHLSWFDYSENNNKPVNDCLRSGSYFLNCDRIEIKERSLLLKKLLDKNVFKEFMKKVLVKIIIFHIKDFLIIWKNIILLVFLNKIFLKNVLIILLMI